MSTLKTNTLSNVAGTASTAIENAINGSAKAWVNFNGTGTVAILGQYNVSSITDLGTGSYRVNFTNAMANSNYGVVIGFRQNETVVGYQPASATTTSIDVYSRVGTASQGTLTDSEAISVAIFR
jgi:hypothetical protein